MTFAEKVAVPELARTTRDEPDYDKLMQYRMHLLKKNELSLPDINRVIASMQPLPGASDFLVDLRQNYQVIILSDTFYEFAMPLMQQLSYPVLFCHSLVADEQGKVTDYRLRMPNQKREAVKRFKQINFKVIAAGDSYNDTAMLQEADAGIFYLAPENVLLEFPQFPGTTTYTELRAKIDQASASFK